MLRTDSTCSALRHHVIVALTRRAARRERGRSYPAISRTLRPLHRTLRPQKEQACTAARTTTLPSSRGEIAISGDLGRSRAS